MKKEVINFRKLYIAQFYGYLILIPFIFGLFSLLKKQDIIDIIIYVSGLIFVFVFLLINQFEPTLRVTKNKFILYNFFSRKPVTLLRKDLKSFEKINDRLIKLRFKQKDYDIQLNKKELKRLISILKETY